jgi:hypothetical protein
MQKCELNYIPTRLHTDNKNTVSQFTVGEFLYRRCEPEILANPFRSISLTELSHNRGGDNSNALCNPTDVLFSIKEEEDFEIYSNKVVCILEIKSLTSQNEYKKEYTQVKNGENYSCVMELLHDPLPCMYPHCVFRIKLNGEIVTYANYKETLDKLKSIRSSIKDELASMIITKSINQGDSISS